jgi:ribosomal 50S subunit-recycling heat shock protein
LRLDLFLKASRLVIRRTQAQALCDAGAVMVNGAPAKSSRAVKLGDEIGLTRGERTMVVRVVDLPDTRQTSRTAATGLYELVSGKQNVLENDHGEV